MRNKKHPFGRFLWGGDGRELVSEDWMMGI